MADVSLVIPEDRLRDYCRRWKVAEMAIFGSALREDFSPHSDIDVLVLFHADARPSLFDLVRIEEELEALLWRRSWAGLWIWCRARPWSRARTTSGAIASSTARRSSMLRDEAHLLDILIAARKALAFVEGMTWETVQRDLPQLIALIQPLVPPENETR